MAAFKEERNWRLNAQLKIKEIFDNCQRTGENWLTKVQMFFSVEIPNFYDQLPWLNETPLHNLQSNQVVHFRGMIQDVNDPEFYMDTYIVKNIDGSEVRRPGRYLDFVSCSPGEEIVLNSPHCETQDRSSYCCISIPGENHWVKEVYVGQNPNSENICVSRKNIEKKRGFPDETEESTDVESNKQNEFIGEGKKLKDENVLVKKEQLRNVSISKVSKFPFSHMEGMVCILKIYDENSDLHLNDIIEAVGILCLDPSLPTSHENEGTDRYFPFGEEFKDKTLPPSLAPRLHVLSIKKRLHCNPLVPSTLERRNFSLCSSGVRELIGSVLDAVFLGDELAAEYFICHLVSSVHSRQDVLPIGKFSLNLCGITQELQDKNYPRLLYELLQNLVTHSHFLPMTLENMNKMDFIPKKDYEENCLKSGFLQLPPNLHLVVDETQLTAGQLDSKGVRNLTALGTLITWQKVDYDFQYHNLEQHTDVPVLILSEGKAMISSDYQIRFDPKHTDVSLAFSEVSSLLTPRVLEQVRNHLTLGRLTPSTLSEDMQRTVQDDFVSSRRHEDGMSADDLHSLLTLTKLLAQSCGKLEVTEDIWKSARMLEMERKRRLRDEGSSA